MWTDEISQGIENVISRSSNQTRVQFEYMDSKRIFDAAYIQQIIDLYLYKFNGSHFDAIISSDDNAFNFLTDYGEMIFPYTPIIFCGTNNITFERAEQIKLSTGVNEAASFRKNIELILDIHSDISEMVVIVDSTTTGILVRKQLEEIIPEFSDQTEFSFLQNYSGEELWETVSKLDPKAVILYTVFFRGRDGKFLEYDDSINLIISASKVPVYVTWDFSMGTGAVGGLLTSGRAQGEAAAKMALQILAGNPVESIPVLMESPNEYIFDYNALSKYNIDVKKLPNNSIILNQPDIYTRKYKLLLLRTVIAGAILFVIILTLIFNIFRRKRAERLLAEVNASLEERVKVRTIDLEESNSKLNDEIEERTLAQEALMKSERLLKVTGNIAKVGGWELDVGTRKLTWTEEIYHINEIDLSYEPDLESALAFYHPESQSFIQKAIQGAIKSGASFDLELKIITSKGNLRWCRAKGETVTKDGVITKVFGTFQDITEMKKAEELMQRQSDRIKVLNSIIRHDISNDLAVIRSAINVYLKKADTKMLDEIVSRVNKSTKTISDYKQHKEYIDSNVDLTEINLYEMLKRIQNEFPILQFAVSKKCSVCADDALFFVFTNLISNSIKHGNASQVNINVIVEETTCVIKVVDNGTGIGDSIKDKIFEEGFFSGETGHTGLGLHLVEENVDLYGGTIEVSDNKPQGAIFTITLKKAISK